MKKISLIDSAYYFNHNLGNVYSENRLLLKNKLDNILFIYLYFLEALYKIYFSKKIYKLLKRLTSKFFNKIYKKTQLFLKSRRNRNFRKIYFKKINFFFYKKRERLLFISKMFITFYRKKIIFFSSYLKRYHKILNIQKNNSYINFLYDILSSNDFNIISNKKYSKDELLDSLNEHFNLDKTIVKRFFKFKILNLKNNQLMRVILLLKKKFNLNLLSNFTTISSFLPFKNSINIKDYLHYNRLYLLNYLQFFKPSSRFYIDFIINNKINIRTKKQIIKFLFFFYKKYSLS